MARASRILGLLAAHCGLAWFAVYAMLDSGGPVSQPFALATTTVFCSQIVLSGIIAGLLADHPGPTQHPYSRPLGCLCVGLPSVWTPVGIAVWAEEGLNTFLLLLFGVWMAVGFFAVVTVVTLSAFGLCLTDQPIRHESLPGKLQFSLRHLIGLTTFTAVACALPKLAAEGDGPISVAAMGILLIATIVFGFAISWLGLIGIPLGVLIGNRPWRNGFLGVAAAGALALASSVVLSQARWNDASIYWGIVGGHLVLSMVSLGIVRSCRLRLAPRMPNEATAHPAAEPDFSASLVDN